MFIVSKQIFLVVEVFSLLFLFVKFDIGLSKQPIVNRTPHWSTISTRDIFVFETDACARHIKSKKRTSDSGNKQTNKYRTTTINKIKWRRKSAHL